MADAERPEWIQCIEQTHVQSWCGQRITGFYFAGLDHAAQSAAMGSRLLPCQECVDAAVKVLRGAEPK